MARRTCHSVGEPGEPPQGQGQRRRHEAFPSALLNNARTVEVYLPPGYDNEPARTYPVLYLHDGQNLFEASESAFGQAWDAQATADRLITAGRLPPLILVGIANTPDRLDEYATVRDHREKAGGRGLLYARFVLDEVKPFIDRHYRTKPERAETGVAGSSMGGLISLLMARRFSDRFARCGVLSPSLWWKNEAVFKELAGDVGWLERMRFWVDMGTREGESPAAARTALAGTRGLIELFDHAGLLPGHDYYYWEVVGGEHNESHWAKRFDKVLLYLFGRPMRDE
jgi:predicted alpha/beta superfamily hydrolase